MGRSPQYFEDVKGPEYEYLPAGQTKELGGVKIESIPVLRGTGFLVETDGVTIFHGGDHLLSGESQRATFHRTIDRLKRTGKRIDLLILPANFVYGRIFPENIEGVENAVKTLEPRAYLATGAESTEYVFKEAGKVLGKHKGRTKIFYPEHRGDMFVLKRK